MTQLAIIAAAAAHAAAGDPIQSEIPMPTIPFMVQFSRSISGQNVTVLIDGKTVKSTFAGKLVIRDRSMMKLTVCADVRAPVTHGQIFQVKPGKTRSMGGNIAMAGNIVAKYFNAARNADQCAGLQLAVWEAIEDGGDQADFASGKFQARAGLTALRYAQEYYKAIEDKADAFYLQAGGGSGQSQITAL